MGNLERRLMNKMWIYCASIKTLYFVGMQHRYAAQIDHIIGKMQENANLQRECAELQLAEVKTSVNVKA